MNEKGLHIIRDTSGLLFNDAFKDTLRKHNLFNFDRIMGFCGGEVVKAAIKERVTSRFFLHDDDSKVELYLKRHFAPSYRKVASQLLKFCLPRTALHELKSILGFHREGLPTMVPVLAGIRQRGAFRSESFLLTAGIQHCKRLDKFLQQFFSPPLSSEKLLQKRALTTALAKLVSKMHQCGFVHRDLYLCHILVDTENTSGWKLYFVDLHRVDRRIKVRKRWMVKDLSALNYSAPSGIITAADRLRFLKSYLHAERFSSEHKLFIQKIMKKSRNIAAHTIKHAENTHERIQ